MLTWMTTATPSGPYSLIAAMVFRTDFALRSTLTRRSGSRISITTRGLPSEATICAASTGSRTMVHLSARAVQDGLGHGGSAPEVMQSGIHTSMHL